MSLRRLKPFNIVTSSSTRCSNSTAATLLVLASSARFQSSSNNNKTEDVDIEAEIAASNQQEFSKIRNALLGGAESASIYSSPGAGTSSSATGFEDPALTNSRYTRLFIESVVDTDPLGGQHRGDYFRNPSAGYAPQHAPRNYGVGGSVDAFHPLSTLHYESTFNSRSEDDHFMQRGASDASISRNALLRRAQQGGGLQAHPSRFSSAASASGGNENGEESMMMQDSSSNMRPSSTYAINTGEQIFNNSRLESYDANTTGFFEQAASPRTARNHVASSQSQTNNNNSNSSRLSWLDAQALQDAETSAAIHHNREAELELFRRVHGERDRERHEEGRNENLIQSNKIGYDVDKIAARAANKIPFRGLPNIVPPGSASEVQSELRKNAISADHAVFQEQAAANTTAASPLMGEGLTRHLVETAAVRKRSSERDIIEDWNQKTGRGRPNPLVSDAGPDQRSQQLGKNDERLLRAAQYDSNVYVKNDNQLRSNEYDKRKTTNGVGHLLDSEFDRRRRADLLAEGKQDPIERTHMHLGQPMREQIDERVRYRSNNRPQRPLEYFLPFPKQTDMLQLQAYSDVEGFPLFAGKMANVRLNPFEWDLFIRYRAHFAQRRDIALKNGLEPRPNESVAERTARRQALDELCEKTPFDAKKYIVLDHGVSIAPADELRQWFGAYWLPSPTLCAVMLGKTIDAGLHLVDEKRAALSGDAKAPLDTREHVLSGRYLSKLLTIDTYNTKLQRQTIKEQYLGRAPEPEIIYRVSGNTLRHFSPEQREAYEEYIKIETDKHVEKWNDILSGRRFVPSQNSHARLMKTYVNDVTTIRSVEGNEEVVSVASAALVHEELAKKTASTSVSESSNNSSSHNNNNEIVLDGVKYSVDMDSTRSETFVEVKTETGAVISMLQSEWNSLPEEHSPTGKDGSLDVNSHLNVGSPKPYSYNRLNYVETQDVLWENRVVSGEEGWTTAIHPDGLNEGLPVRARRSFGTVGSGDLRYGDFERATIEKYFTQPFYNPNPREVSVVFHDEASPVKVPLSNVSIWQTMWSGQERTKPLNTHKLGGGMRRFVNMQDPKGEKSSSSSASSSHFLDKYLTTKQHLEMSQKWRYSKNVADIDKFTTFDINRPHNHRLISGTGVRHYIRSGFMHRYTPWEFILTQEAEAPMIAEQLRSNESAGTSHFFSPNRFWRYKRRAYGYIKNHANEVRDLFQYVDAITPWEKAKQIRTHWEVREHHPMPAYMRPALGVHRNHAKLLPAHLWDSDKKTGKVKVLKDSLKDYRPVNVHPTWTHL